MDKERELRLFQQLGGSSEFRQWIEFQEAKELGVLVDALDSVQVNRAQGRVKWIQTLRQNIARALDVQVPPASR